MIVLKENRNNVQLVAPYNSYYNQYSPKVHGTGGKMSLGGTINIHSDETGARVPTSFSDFIRVAVNASSPATQAH